MGEARRQGRPSTSDTAEINRAIEEAVLAEAAEGCMSAISIERIAARAGVTRTAIYRRFANRQALLCGAIATRVGHLKKAIAADRAIGGTPVEQLRRLLHLLMRETNSHAGLDLRRLIIATGPHDGEVLAALLDAQRFCKAACDDALAAVVTGKTCHGFASSDLRELLLDTLATGRVASALTIGTEGAQQDELDRVFDLRWAVLRQLF